jgi:hypothetical protein
MSTNAGSPFIDVIEHQIAANTPVLTGRSHASRFIATDDRFVTGYATTAASIDWLHVKKNTVKSKIPVCARTQEFERLGLILGIHRIDPAKVRNMRR